ncbi:hypothetical protein M378DRAFT_166004 [Amanita muscaria Koide BX008]|uniref:Crinkler effector protein N-terminal domain-containing protein n=1 Tax=Amanita muscaria (strain Koide BX008) TaxID=946122 RepID=A0A0C2WZ75_AMAMK|nr:hypothetical protein M378DRAFT_166004 [Amanita muscaria Koide BX008]
MPLVRFKLRRANAATRLANFNVQPNWEDLASNITEKFEIPLDRVGVVFVNEAKATITITGEEQLQDFYKSLNQSSNEIMFVVQDLATPDPERIITSTWSIGSQTSKNHSIVGSDDKFRLFCWALKSDRPFSVKIGKSETVDELKKVIKKEMEPILVDIRANMLDIWKLSSPIHSSDLDKKLRHAQTPNDIEGCKLLDPFNTLLEHFTSPPGKHIHIIVQHPPIPSRKHGLLHDDPEAKRQKTDDDLSWLSKVHSEIWNRRDERSKDLVHKVTVTVAHYRELQQRLSRRPNQDSDEDILAIKRDILLNYKSNSNIPGNEQVPANVDEESGDDDPELDSFLPATFEFLDLSSLNLEDQPPRLPLPLFIRPEYSIILEETQLQRVHSSNSRMVTGQPGIGTTAFLHYMMIKYMLDGIPFLYQSIDGIVYHVYRDGVETIESWKSSKSIVAFVDADGNKNTPQWFIQRKCVQFILASSPTGASPRWFKQIADFMVEQILELWTPCEFYVTGIFLHPSHLDLARLRESASYFGLNPRRCFQASRSEIHMRSGRLHVTKSIRSIDSSVNIYDLMMGTFDSKHASHAVFEMFPKDENRHLLEARIRAVSKWALKQLMEEYIKREASALADFYKKITRIPMARQLRGEMFQLWALNYFDTIDQATTFRIRNLATSEELDWLYPGPASHLTFPSQSISTDLWLKIVQNKEPQHMIPMIPNFAVDSILYNPNSVLTGFQMTVKKVHPISVSGLQRIQQSLKPNTPLASLRPSNREGEHWRLIFVVPDYEAASYPLQQFEGTEDTGIWARKVDQYVLGLNEDEIMKVFSP